MAEQIKELIEKIQQEGVKAAQDQARVIEEEANRQAKAIVEKAKLEAEKIISDARRQVEAMQESQKVLLGQAGRNLLIVLRKEINAMLDRLVASSVREALKPEDMAKFLSTLIKDYSGKLKENIVISLNKQDFEELEKGFLSKLKDETKKSIILKPSEEIVGGFIISYDAGKSHYDFTDKALAEYIGSFLKPKLAEILKGSI